MLFDPGILLLGVDLRKVLRMGIVRMALVIAAGSCPGVPSEGAGM